MVVIRRWICNISPTCLCITSSFCHKIHIKDSSFYCLIINISFVLRTGKKRIDSAQQSENTIAASLIILCRRSNCSCPVVNILTTIRFWKAHFICILLSSTSHRPVTGQLQPVTEHSPASHRSVWKIASQSPYLRITDADQLPINHWQVAKPIAGWLAIIP